MSAYPESWEIGDPRARNLVPRPRFDSSDRGLWAAGIVSEANGPGLDGGYAYRLIISNTASSATTTSIPLLDTYEPGVEFDVMIHYAYAEETIPLYVYVADKRHGANHIPETHKAQLPATPDRWTFTTEIVTVKTPEDTFYTEGRNDPFTPATLDLCVRGRGNATYFSYSRVDYPGSAIVGYFDGDNEDTDELAHGWTGDPLVSASTALALTAGGEAPDPDPHPDPEPEPGDTTALGRRVAAFLGQHGNEGLEQLATQHAAVIAAMAEAYTRGNGFTDGEPAAPIAAVIVTATARLLGNPQQLARHIGDVNYRGGFAGWSLAELYVLNNYRKRQA